MTQVMISLLVSICSLLYGFQPFLLLLLGPSEQDERLLRGRDLQTVCVTLVYSNLAPDRSDHSSELVRVLAHVEQTVNQDVGKEPEVQSVHLTVTIQLSKRSVLDMLSIGSKYRRHFLVWNEQALDFVPVVVVVVVSESVCVHETMNTNTYNFNALF